MKKAISILAILMFVFSINAFSIQAIYERDKPKEIVGWSIYGADDDIDAAAEMITELDTTYAQLWGTDKVEVLSASAADITQTVTVTGVDSSDNRVSEEIALNTADGTTVVTSSTTFKYVEGASLDAPCAGAITIRRKTGDTLIISIPIGAMEATAVQHFNGDYNSYITDWRASVTSTTGAVTFQLRAYLDDSKSIGTNWTTGAIILDEIALTNVLSTQHHPFPQPIKVPAGSWIVVSGLGGAANSDGSVTVQGYDSKS